jgi:hypothetical protein
MSSAGEDKTNLQSERKSAPVSEENKPFFLNKILTTPAVRRIAVENNVRLYFICFYVKEKPTLLISLPSLFTKSHSQLWCLFLFP